MTKEPLTPEAIDEQRRELGETIAVGLPQPSECLDIYKAMGASRSLEKMRKYLANRGRKAPAITTLKKWSKLHNWAFHVDTYDRECAAIAEKKIKEEHALDIAEDLHGLATKYRRTAHKLIVKIDQKIAGLKLADGTQIRAAIEAATALSKAAEVLDGGVSDRTESKTTLTVEERKSAAQRLVDDAFKSGRFSGQDNAATKSIEPVGNAADAGGSSAGVQGDLGVGERNIA